MPDKDAIEPGDIVDIFFPNGDMLLKAEVLGCPYATGDSWRIRDKNGQLYYLQQFNMKLVSKKEPQCLNQPS